ncbi:MAG TPA: ribosome biogenesis GTP-binding protein YihA/YsxC [Polyangiales bacterium]|nr:ribosome biogenesis GTP-binding protein YihA/YsxC [Polyangiales bacterium]
MPFDVLEADYLITAVKVEGLPPPMFAEVAFAGRSNVGKSSLINSLAQRKKLARTSSTPGCTRGLNLFRLTLRGDAHIDFVDLPGYGFAQRSKQERISWGPMIEGFLTHRVGLRGVAILVDVRRGLEDEERELLEFLAHVKQRAIVVATKIDRVPSSKRKHVVMELAKKSGVKALPFSSHSGEGRDQLWSALLRMAAIDLNPAPMLPPTPKG